MADSFLVCPNLSMLLFKFLFVIVPCTEADMGNSSCRSCLSVYISIGQTVHKHKHTHICNKNKGKMETGKATGSKGGDNNSELTQALSGKTC